jgi:hypothetical protein
MPTFSISDHGLFIQRQGPPHSPDDVAARRRAVVQALEILRPVVRPLALEITLGPLEPETFAVTPTTNRRLASRAIPAGVAHQSAFAHSAEVEVVDAITPDLVLQAITPEAPGWDFATIEALVTAARTSERETIIDRMPSRAVPMLELDGGRWLVGPIDAPGYRLQPPIRLRWRQQWGELSLIIQALWSLWWQTGSPEHTGLRAAERALDAAGFTAPDDPAA